MVIWQIQNSQNVKIVCASRILPTPSWLCGCVAPFSLSLYACETRCFMWSQGKTIVKAYRYERSTQGCENETKMRSTASEILTNSVPHEQKATIWAKAPKIETKVRPKGLKWSTKDLKWHPKGAQNERGGPQNRILRISNRK